MTGLAITAFPAKIGGPLQWGRGISDQAAFLLFSSAKIIAIKKLALKSSRRTHENSFSLIRKPVPFRGDRKHVHEDNEPRILGTGSLYPGDICAGAGVNPDDIPFFYKHRHIHTLTGLYRNPLGYAGGSVTPDGNIRLDHF